MARQEEMKMARGNIGSFNGAVSAGVDMVEVFKAAEAEKNPKFKFSAGFCIRKISIAAAAGTQFTINGAEIHLPESGLFQTDEDEIEVESLIFNSAANVNIVYLY